MMVICFVNKLVNYSDAVVLSPQCTELIVVVILIFNNEFAINLEGYIIFSFVVVSIV